MKIEHDTITVQIEAEVRKEFRNVAKHKRELLPVLNYRIDLYVNGHKFDEDEVFVVDVFFQSLLAPGKYPMFTCTCGIFGCGGYYVDVYHEDHSVIWITEQTPFMDKSVPGQRRFVFPFHEMSAFAQALVYKLEEVREICLSHGLDFQYDREQYTAVIQSYKSKRG
ncbi:hypothetical protein [Paenibacillus sanfengchensis]|uniref:hypothetical protein n=1 Tax=Paenibacillus sanfengchensis TaxID=3119819 RepID=UPI002FE0CCC8